KREVDDTIGKLPLVSNIRDLSQQWPELTKDVKSLMVLVRLGHVRHQVLIEHTKAFYRAARLVAELPAENRTKATLDVLEQCTIDATNTFHLISGNLRYVRQAASVYEDGEEIPVFTKKLLPQLCLIYRDLNQELCDVVEDLKKIVDA